MKQRSPKSLSGWFAHWGFHKSPPAAWTSPSAPPYTSSLSWSSSSWPPWRWSSHSHYGGNMWLMNMMCHQHILIILTGKIVWQGRVCCARPDQQTNTNTMTPRKHPQRDFWPLHRFTPFGNWWQVWQLRRTVPTFIVSLQSRATLDSILNSWDV